MTRKPEQAIAVRERSAVDDYERNYMAGQGEVLHRTKRPAPRWMQLALASSTLAGLGMLLSPAWIGGLVMIPMGFLVWALFSVLRFTVSEGSVNIQYGLFGPTIPTSAIKSAEAVDYDWKKFGGWGIKRSLGGAWIYNMPGDNGRAVRIVWTDKKGRERTTYVGMPEPEPAEAAIHKAMKALPPPPDRNALPGGDEEVQ